MRKRQHVLELIFPKARANLLRLLFTKPKKACYLRELARRGHISVGTAHDELATLLTAGLITTSFNGYRRFYRPNQNHDLFPHVLGIVHGCGRMREVDVSSLRRVRRRKWKKKQRPEPVYWRPPARPTGTMFRPDRT